MVLIDEAEQFLSHFFSDTMVGRGKQDRHFKILREFVRTAKYVVALDADLAYRTTNTLARMVSVPDADGVLRPSKPSYLWINETPSPDRKLIELYESKEHLAEDLLQAIADGKRCFVPANSKNLVVKLDAIIRERFGETRRVIMITSDTSGRPEAQDFIENAAARALTYDVILCSPSLGTGVDITFPDNAQRVDLVVGFCEPEINTHLDFDQQLARVRNPGTIKVWITSRRSNYETHLDVVRHDILRAGLYKDLLDGFDDDGKPRFLEDDPLIELAALVKSDERISKNNLRGNYIRYKEAQGCTFVHVSRDPERSFGGHIALKLGAGLAEEERVAKILAAPVLTKVETENVRRQIDAGAVVSEALQWSYEATNFKLFYRAEATPELIRLDRDGRLRQQVRLFEKIARLPPEAMPADRSAPLHRDLSFVGDTEQDLAPALVRILRLIPLWREHPHTRIPHPEGQAEIERGRLIPPIDAWLQTQDGRVAGSFDPEAVIETANLQAFAQFMLDNRKPLENLFGFEIRSDLRRKPMQQLGQVLRLVGLALTLIDTRKVAGRKIRSYRLEASAFATMTEIMARRERMRGWAFLVDYYGSHIDPSDQDDFSDTEAQIERAREFLRGTTGTFQEEV
ncbi:hypothetical protein MKL11_07590 [Methylobacterium sp. J-077]|nr:hypothetical protein [Methylobacterium sp. J-077]